MNQHIFLRPLPRFLFARRVLSNIAHGAARCGRYPLGAGVPTQIVLQSWGPTLKKSVGIGRGDHAKSFENLFGPWNLLKLAFWGPGTLKIGLPGPNM